MSDPIAAARPAWRQIFSRTVLVGALGYFVDIFDIVLLGVVRQSSSATLGLTQAQSEGLLPWQMWGMLLGGVLWGVMGDRLSRKGVLYGSILVYALANLLNAAVQATPVMGLDAYHQYALLRFVAGFGLAGELGAAVTMVAESTPARLRGYATAVVAGVGVAGAVAANLTFKLSTAWQEDLGLAGWRSTYLVGGLLGLAILAVRFGIRDSALFHDLKAQGISRGNLLMLVNQSQRFCRFALCVLIGLPLWAVVGLAVHLSPELAASLGTPDGAKVVKAGDALMWCYIGLIAGDFGSGFISQIIGSRRRTVMGFLSLTAIILMFYLTRHAPSPELVYACCGGLGFAAGYWAVFVTVAAEQFGTNLRATVASLVPNLVRGAVPLFVALFTWAGRSASAALIIILTAIVIAFIAAWRLPETHSRDMDFLER
jgi:MFS family permease